jgi:hypothetical protein
LNYTLMLTVWYTTSYMRRMKLLSKQRAAALEEA